MLQAVQTELGKYQVQTRGGLNNSFAFRKDDFGGVVIILQPFGSDGNTLEGDIAHFPFYGTTEPPHDLDGSTFKPIAPFAISPAGFGAYISNLNPSITLDGGGPGVPYSVTRANDPKNFYARDFIAFNNRAPGSSGTFKLALGSEDECEYSTLEGFRGQTSPSFVTLRQQAAEAVGILRTTKIYKGEPFFSVRYQLRDASGRPQILTAGVTVTMSVDRQLNSDSVEQACTAPSPVNGGGDCHTTVPDSWFLTERDWTVTAVITVKYGETIVAMSAEQVSVLQGIVAAPDRAAMGAHIYLFMPLNPVYSGDSFQTTVLANTDGQSLISWMIVLEWDPAVVMYSAFVGDAKYTAPVTQLNADATSLRVVSVGLKTGQAVSDTQGLGVSVGTVRWTMKAGITAQTFNKAIWGTVNTMVNEGTHDYVLNTAVQFEHLEGSGADGTLVVIQPSVTGIYSFLDQAEVLNTAFFSGVDQAYNMTVMRVWDRATKADSVTDSTVSCLSDFNAAAQADDRVGGCTVKVLTGSNDGYRTTITANADGFTSTAPFTTYFPLERAIMVDDEVLNPIKGAKQVGNCGRSLYQKSMIRVKATYGGNGLTSLPDIDVTCSSFFVSDRPEVASVSGRVVTGISQGNVTISFTGGSSDLVGTATVMVGGPEVNVTKLETVLPNRAQWSAFLSPEPVMNQNYTARVTIEQSLKFDGDGGPVYTQAIFSDGRYQYVTPGGGSVVSVTPEYDNILSSTPGSGSLPTRVFLKYNAVSFAAADVLVSTWTDLCSNTAIASGSGEMFAVLAKPFQASVAVKPSNYITHPSSSAVLPPASIQTELQLSVMLKYTSGDTVDFTEDARTVYRITVGQEFASVTDKGVVSVTEAGQYGMIKIEVTFPTYTEAGQLKGTRTLYAVGVEELSLFSTPYPAYTGSHESELYAATLKQMGCSGGYQWAGLVAKMTHRRQRARRVQRYPQV